jgi:hypothetical protein
MYFVNFGHNIPHQHNESLNHSLLSEAPNEEQNRSTIIRQNIIKGIR